MPRATGKNTGRISSVASRSTSSQQQSSRTEPQATPGIDPPGDDGTHYLVALAGVKALHSHIKDLSRARKWKDRVASWEERAGLGVPSVKLALGFLDVLGVNRASIYKRLLENSLRILLDRIPSLSEEQRLELLNDSFRYATQPELKSVPLKIITSMSVVPDKVLDKIIELQTQEPTQFEELGLPIAIKRLAWERSSTLFVKVVSPHAEAYIASEYSPKMIQASQQLKNYKSLDTVKRRKLMNPQGINGLAECTGGRPVLVGYLCDYVADRFAQEPSQSKTGLWATLLTDMLVTTRERAYGAIPDQAVDRLCALASRLDLAVREDVFGDAAVREVQRLFREATGIVEDQQERAKATKGTSAAAKAAQEDDSTRLRKILQSAWSSVSKGDGDGWFKAPVTEAIAPGYLKIIQTPMDLSTILKKIKSGGYTNFEDFERDLRLMWENCRVYNGADSPLFTEATRQEGEWSKVAKSFQETLRRQTLQSRQAAATAAATANSGGGAANRKRGAGVDQPSDDARGGAGGASLAPMASATQLERDGLGRLIGIAAILLSEPFAAKLMYRHASVAAVEACRVREILPRDHPTFAPLLQLLELGGVARAMFQAQSFGVRAVEEGLIRSVLPCVVALHAMAHGATEASRARAGGNHKEAEDPVRSDEDLGGVKEDWRKWYKEYPTVRRVTCTMLCRGIVRGGDGATTLLLPAARAAVKKMADEEWLWSTISDMAKKNAAPSKGGSPFRLKPQTVVGLFELFSRGLDAASASDVVAIQALELVHNFLPAPSSGSAAGPETPALAVSIPMALLEDIVDKVVAAIASDKDGSASAANSRRLKDVLKRIFAKVPEWRTKVAPKVSPRGNSGMQGGKGAKSGTSRGSMPAKGSKRKQSKGRGDGDGKGTAAPSPAKKRVRS